MTERDTEMVSIRLESGIVSSYPYEVINRAEVSRGRQSSGTGARKGLIRGAAVGFAAPVTIFLIASTVGDAEGCEGCEEPERVSFFDPKVRSFILIPTLAGAALGYAFGSQARERWEEISLPNRRISVRATPGGAEVGVSVRF